MVTPVKAIKIWLYPPMRYFHPHNLLKLACAMRYLKASLQIFDADSSVSTAFHPPIYSLNYAIVYFKLEKGELHGCTSIVNKIPSKLHAETRQNGMHLVHS